MALNIGQKQYDAYIKERLKGSTKAVSDTISRNKLPVFGSPKERIKVKMQISSLKSDCNPFARLYIACQMRDGNLEKFFKHENQSEPPSLASMGKLRLGQKSDLLPCFKQDRGLSPPEVDVKDFDGVALVKMLPSRQCKT